MLMKSRKMRGVEHVTDTDERKNYTEFWLGYQKIKHLQDLEVHGCANIKRELRK